MRTSCARGRRSCRRRRSLVGLHHASTKPPAGWASSTGGRGRSAWRRSRGTRDCRAPRRNILDVRGLDDNARCLDARRRRAFVGGVRRVAGGHQFGCAHRDDVDRRGRAAGRRAMFDNRPRIWFSLFVLAVFCVGLASGVLLGRRMVGPPGRPFGKFEGPSGPGLREAVRRRGFSSTGSIANCLSRTSSAPASGASSRRAASASINSSRTRTTAWRASSATCENRFAPADARAAGEVRSMDRSQPSTGTRATRTWRAAARFATVVLPACRPG